MGTPKNPEVLDTVTLYDSDGNSRLFSVCYVDEGFVHLDSMNGNMAHFTRKEFEQLFEERGE